MPPKAGVENQSQNAEKSSYPSIKPVEPAKEASTSSPEKTLPPKETHTTPEISVKPPSLTEEPYLVGMLKLDFSKDHFEMPQLIAEANEFILSEIKRYRLKDSSESYEQIINKYLKKLPDTLDDYTKIEQLIDLIRIDKKLIEAMNEKDRIMNADITDLSSSQIKRRLEWDKM